MLKRSGFKWKPRKPLKRTPLARGSVKLAQKRKKRSPKQILRDKAWDTFSLWIRARDGRCVTCGSYKLLQAGHFFHGVLDFDEININAQCTQCNYYKSGNLAVYANYLLNKYGQHAFEQLDARHYLAMRGEYKTEEEYQAIIDKYSQIV